MSQPNAKRKSLNSTFSTRQETGATGGDMHLQGNQVSLNALTENEQTHLHQYHRSSGMGISAVYNPVKVFKDNFGQQAEQGSATGIIGKIFTAVDAVAKTGNQVTNLGGAYANTHRSSLDKNRYQERAVVTTANAGGDLSIIATAGSPPMALVSDECQYLSITSG